MSAGRRWYLVGYDNDRDDWRIFRVDRITDLRPTRIRVAARQLPASDAASFVTEKLLELTPVYRAVVTLYAPVERMAGPLGGAGVDLEPIDATSLPAAQQRRHAGVAGVAPADPRLRRSRCTSRRS